MSEFTPAEIAETSFKGTARIFVGNLISSIIALIALVLLARLLGPDLFGQIAIILILSSLILLIQDLAIGQAITRYILVI